MTPCTNISTKDSKG